MTRATNGTKIASYTTPSSSWSSPTIANGMLYVGCNDWDVYCFSNNVTNEVSTPSQVSTPSPSVTLTRYGLEIVIAIIAATVVIVIVAIGYTVRKQAKK